MRMPLFNKIKAQSGLVALMQTDTGVCVTRVVHNRGSRPRVTLFERRAWDAEFLNSQVLNASPDGAVLWAHVAHDHRLAEAHCTTLLAQKDYKLVLTEAPDVPAEELRSVLRWRIKDLIDFHIDDATLDAFDLPGVSQPGRPRSMYAVVARSAAIRQRADVLGDANINLEVIDLPEMAQRNLAAQLEADVQGVVMLSFSDDSGLITITRQGELYMSRTLDIGLNQFARETEFDAAYQRIALEVQRSIDYYDSHFHNEAINELVLLPMGEEPSGFVDSLTDALNLRVSILDLAELLQWEVEVPEKLKAACALNIGAALRQETSIYADRQVNLYHPIFRRQKQQFSAKTMVQATLALLVGVGLLAGWQLLGVVRAQSELDRQGRKAERLQQQIQIMNAESKARDRGRSLSTELSRLEQLVAARGRIRTILASDTFANTTGYSVHLRALARQHVSGLWITGLHINANGRRVTLQGRAYRPELVPQYIGRLANEKSMQGLAFDRFRLSRPQDKPGGKRMNYVEFFVTSAGGGRP